MGRWGHCLFEGDNDLDRAGDLAVEITGGEDGPEREALCSFGCAKIGFNAATPLDISALERLRQKIDAGLGNKIMDKYRSLVTATNDAWKKHEAKYEFIILGALMMRVGAKIRDDDVQHLRQLASEVQANEGYTLPLFDTGFRGPSKRQFLAALDYYTPGTPRNFNQPSCHTCGKTKQDTGKAPMKCSGCEKGWFCDKDCQRSLWGIHKKNCGPRRSSGLGFYSLNV